MLLKQVCPQAGKLDSPGTAVPVLVIVGDNDEEEVAFDVDEAVVVLADKVVVGFIEDVEEEEMITEDEVWDDEEAGFVVDEEVVLADEVVVDFIEDVEDEDMITEDEVLDDEEVVWTAEVVGGAVNPSKASAKIIVPAVAVTDISVQYAVELYDETSYT